MMKKFLTFLAASLLTANMAVADDCKNRGTLDEMYCDENMDLVADSPKDSEKWKDPKTLVFTYTPVEDPAVYKDAFADFQAYLEEATGKKVIYYTVQSNAAEVEAIRAKQEAERIQAEAHAKAEFLAAVAKLQQEGGHLFVDPENLNAILRAALPPAEPEEAKQDQDQRPGIDDEPDGILPSPA